MPYQFIQFEVVDGVAKLSLNRQDVLNSFNRPMALEAQDALKKCSIDQQIRAIYLTGEGRAFCAGQDLEEAIAPASDIAEIVRNSYNPIIKIIREIEKPVICAVNGVAAGAGANIAFACDITFAAESAKFVQSFSNIGLIPDSLGTYFLPRLVGMQRAAALTMLAEKITANQAQEYGLIWKAIPDQELHDTAYSTAVKLAKMPTKGLGLTKRGFNEGLLNNIEQQLELEVELQAEAGSSYDYQEGVNAFLEKRKPIFKGA